jgi:hypothetical protein
MFLRKENDMSYGYVVDNKKYLLNLFVSSFFLQSPDSIK